MIFKKVMSSSRAHTTTIYNIKSIPKLHCLYRSVHFDKDVINDPIPNLSYLSVISINDGAFHLRKTMTPHFILVVLTACLWKTMILLMKMTIN